MAWHSVNVVLLGALSYWGHDVSLPVWLEAMRNRVPPKFAELNEQVFIIGREELEKLHPCPVAQAPSGS
jgi:hypothetical protein